MSSHEEILKRMNEANPLPDVEMITDGQLAEMTLQVEKARRADAGQPQPLTPVRPKVRWRRPAIAFAAAVLAASVVIGAVSLVTGGDSDVADEQPSTTTTPTTSTTLNLLPDGWNPVLATTFAGVPPQPAVCPPGTDPTSPGPKYQERPAVGSVGLLSAAFDHRTGRVVFVDEDGDTWGLDVCTNTWTNLHPTGWPTGNISGGLVYDIDSDLTVALEEDEVFVYDAALNTWEQRTNTSSVTGWPVGISYDPVSGLIIAASPLHSNMDDWLIQAYDVDADAWHDLGVVPLPREGPCCTGIDLLGYSAELDRLILTTYVQDEEATLLLDPRSGEMAVHAIPTPVVDLGWSGRSYGQGDTVWVQATDEVQNGRRTKVLCGFDSSEIAWSLCFAAPDDFPSLRYEIFNAIVGDPVNDRLLLLGGLYNTFSSNPPGINDVWAIDLDTGEWTEVVEPAEPLNDSIDEALEGLSGESEVEEPRQAPPDTADAAPLGEWNSILADTRAGPTPSAATCPPGTDPNTPGPVGQERPTTTDDDHDGAFDRRTGRIMYVDDLQRTWAFDVCTNTWHNLEPVGTPLYRSLVYDVDSDVTIAVGPIVSVYDAAANEWTRPTLEIVGDPPPRRFWGVAYDPVSGLVIATADQQQVWALDVDAPSLTMISSKPQGVDLAGYVESIDRLVGLAVGQTYLINPRNGETTFADSGEVPDSGWGRFGFLAADGTVFIGSVGIDGRGAGCGFNTKSLAWDRCYQGLSPTIESFSSRVEDSINGRVVLIHHYNVVHSSVADVSSGVVDDVWALDLATGEMVELLAPSG